MPLLNYTTRVSPEKTLAEIQRRLAAHGARGVMVAYGPDRVAEGVAFVVPTAFGDRSFRLPARAEAVERTLKDQHRRGKVPRRYVTREQAARVAWRIVKDWLEAQLAIVESGMVTLDEVMLPYMLNGRDQTCYQALVEARLQLPGPGS